MVNGRADMDPLRTARATPPKEAILLDLHSMGRATPTTVILPEIPLALATPIAAILHERPMALAIQIAILRELLHLALAMHGNLENLLNMALVTARNMVLVKALNMALAATNPHPPHTTGSEGDHGVFPSLFLL